MKSKKFELILAAMALLVFLAACVSETPKNEFSGLQLQYNLLVAVLGKDDAQVSLLKGEVKVIFLNQLLFPEGNYKLNLYSESILDKLVPSLSTLKEMKVTVSGYTDNAPIGQSLKNEGITSNINLSLKRAEAVVNYLEIRGVKDSIISAQGYGESNPVASNDTSGGRIKNRRIEIVLVSDGKKH